jgi:hypothetical protein
MLDLMMLWRSLCFQEQPNQLKVIIMVKILFQRTKDEGCRVVVNWQDSNSSSTKAVKDVYYDIDTDQK